MLVCVISTLGGTLGQENNLSFVLGSCRAVRVDDGLELAGAHDVEVLLFGGGRF